MFLPRKAFTHLGDSGTSTFGWFSLPPDPSLARIPLPL
jgi:hypothetical protein